MNIRILGALYARKAGRQQTRRQLFDSGHSDFLLIQISPFTLHRGEEFARHGLKDYTDNQLARFLKSERHAEAGVPVGKIGGAVERIDVPAERRVAFPASTLLGYNRVLGKMGPQPRNDGLFGALVGLRYDIDFALIADLNRTVEFLEQNRSRFPRRFNGYIEKWIHATLRSSH